MGVSGAGAGCAFLETGATETPVVVLQKSGVRATVVTPLCEAQEEKMPIPKMLNTSTLPVTKKRFFLIRQLFTRKGNPLQR